MPPLHRFLRGLGDSWPLLGAGLVYAWFWPLVTDDMGQSYAPWLAHVVATGPVHAFAAPFGDYPPPWLYLLALLSLLHEWLPAAAIVKLVGVSGTALLTLATWRLLRALGIERAWRGAAFVPLLPGVALNASLMASGDSLWAAPCMMALACGVRRRHMAMLAWCGVAVAVKQQAVFVAPFFLALLLIRRVPVRWWPIAPATALLTYIPAWIAGWPATDLLTIYIRQAGFRDQMALNAPNVWSLLGLLPGSAAVPLTGLALAAALGAAAWYVAALLARRPEGAALVTAAALSPLLVAGLLPRMHERYFFLADVLSLAAAVAGERRASVDAMLVQAGSTLAILAYMSGIGWLAAAGAVPMLAATWRIARRLLRPSAFPMARDLHRQGSWPQFISE